MNYKINIDRKLVLELVGYNKEDKQYNEMVDAYYKVESDILRKVNVKSCFKMIKKPPEYEFEILNSCEYILLSVITLGQSVSNLLNSYFVQGEHMKGILCDTILDYILFDVGNQFNFYLFEYAKKINMGMTRRISVGDNIGFNGTKLPLEYQKDIVNRIDAQKTIGINVSENFIIEPNKSLACIYGADKALTIQARIKQCDKCTNVNCKFRNRL